jgi:hypothetical protein
MVSAHKRVTGAHLACAHTCSCDTVIAMRNTKTRTKTRVNVWIDDETLIEMRRAAEFYRMPVAQIIRQRLMGNQLAAPQEG